MDLISKPRSKSSVWLYFGLKADDKGQPLNSGEAICRLCRKIVLAKGGNTTNLRSHLRRRHRADFFENISSTTSGALFEDQVLKPLPLQLMELTATTMNADLIDSREKLDLFGPDMKTQEEIILKEEDESQDGEECEVNATDIPRHAMVSDMELDELEDSRTESKLTKKQTLWAVNCFTGWLESQGLQVDLATVDKTELNGLLRHFYGSVRNSKGELYGIASYIALRAGLNRYFKEPPVSRPVSLMKDAEFISANKVFLGVLKKIRKSGRDITLHHQALSPDDIRILRHSRVMDTGTPRGLLNKVWFDIQVYFGRRGKQANRNLKPDSFVIRKDKSGLRYCTSFFGDETKNHTKTDRCSMFEKPGSEFCPITSLLKYLSKLPSNATALYLQPKKNFVDDIWYSHTPLGVNYLGSMLSRMSKEACMSVIYTNHCIRSTPFHQLCDAGLERREIIPVSLHRSETSLQSHQMPSVGSLNPRSKILQESNSADPAGLDLNNDEFFEDVPFLQTASNTNYVPDAVLPPGEPWLHGGPSRAVLSLPSCLFLCGDIGSGTSGPGFSGEEQMGEMKVYAKCHLQEGVMFGPYVGEVCREQMPTNLKYAWAIRDDAAFNYVDASDESKSNWMRYVTYTSREEGHNLVIFQFYRHIYYKVSQPITEGAELRVWIGKDYATLLGLGMGGNVKCEFGDKETVLRLLQDIQLVTLPEPSSSSLWSDHSQSQSPMFVISDVTTMSNPDTASDSGIISGSAFPSSLISLPSPGSHSFEKYDFLPGTERLLSNPKATHNSPWHFFGLEPDPTGRPLDRCTAVCKLCGDHVGCGGGAADLQNHLTSKHHIRPPRDGVKDRSFLTIGQQRSQPVMGNSGLVSTLPLVFSAHVTDAIANFLIMDVQPPALVEGDGFKQLIHTLLPSYKELPSPWQLEHLLKEHHTKGKTSLAQLLRKKMGSSNNEDISDYTAPMEFESRRRGRPPSHRKEVPHFVTLSVDVWLHNWQGNTERYLTLWAHYIDCNFSFQNLALATQRLAEGGVKDYSLQAVEAQVKGMAQEWGISMPNLVLLGGELRNKMRLGLIKSSKGVEAAGSVPHPNSTTFLEREDTVSRDEPRGLEHGHSSEDLPSVPCFFSAVQGCIEEVMSHSVISKTLSQFQGVLTTLFMPPAQNKCLYQHHVQSLLQTLKKREQAELKSWAHSRPTWNTLYPLLSMLIKHKSLFCDMLKEIKSERLSKEDTGSESSSSGSCHANSTSSSASFTTLRSEWKVVEELCLVLKPLDVACRTLAKEAFPRLTLIKPILTGLLSRHLVPRTGDSSSILKEVKRMMRRNLASCYENPVVNRVLCVACSLDPQFHGLGFMEDKEQKATFDWLKKEAVRIVKEDRRRSHGHKQSQSKRSPSPGSPESESDFLRRSKRLKESRPINFREVEDEESDAGEADESELADPGPQGGLSGMEFLLGDLFCSAPKSRQSSVEESVDMEMSVFRADKGASLGVEPLQWWRTKAVQFPLLATVARAYLAAPAVAGSAAKDFAQEGALATYRKRDNIPPESLDSILFLHHNHTPPTESGQKAARNDDKNCGI